MNLWEKYQGLLYFNIDRIIFLVIPYSSTDFGLNLAKSYL